jgi:hypothetical protein
MYVGHIYVELFVQVEITPSPLAPSSHYPKPVLPLGFVSYPPSLARSASMTAFFGVWRFTRRSKPIEVLFTVSLASYKGFDPTVQLSFNTFSLASFQWLHSH